MDIKKIYTLLFALCLFSCFDEIKTETNEDISNSINFLADMQAGTNTRTSINIDFKTTFGENDEIGIFIYSRNEGEEPSIDENDLYVSNMKLTYINGIWELERPIYYPDSKKLLDIYAYYPYKDNTDANSLEYNAHEEMKELLMTSVIGAKKSNSAIMLKFQHMQSLVHITLTKDDNVPDFGNNLRVFFNGVIGGKYNIATQELTEPLDGIIKMDLIGKADGKVRTYIAYVPEQEVVSGMLFSIVQTTSNNEIMSSMDIHQSETFIRGHARLFYVRIRQEISKDIRYNLFDLYPAYGTPIGMVIETFNGGKNGKVISLKNIEGVQWAVTDAVGINTNAIDIHDGISNKMKVQSLEDWENNFPAFKACVEYGEKWYLPAIGELSWFMTNTGFFGNKDLLSQINLHLENHKKNNSTLDIQLINADQSYFSSTEFDSDHTRAMKLYPSSKATIADPKDWRYFVRPFYEF